MEFLRKIFERVNQHRKISFVVVLVILGLVWGARRLADLNAGMPTAPLKRGTITQAVYGIGTVTAQRSFSLKPGITSSINELFVREGDSVKKGAKLATVEHVLYTAPFDGTISYLPFKVGENVFAQFPLLLLVNLQDRYLVVSMEQQGALRVKAGQTVDVSFDTQRENTFHGRVEAVYSNDSNYLARIQVEGMGYNILPGMTADVAIKISERQGILSIPVSAYDLGMVWVKKGGRGLPQQIPVKIGVVDKEMAEVLSGGLAEGDVLLIKKKGG